MTRKTKQEKILAQYRKKLKLLEQLSVAKTPPQSTPPPDKTGLNLKPASYQSDQLIDRKKYFFADLRKSSLIISLIITLELLIYFVRIKIY